MEQAVQHLDRRRFMSLLAGLGLAGTTLPDILWAQAGSDDPLTDADVAAAARLAGLELTAEERELMITSLDQLRENYRALRRVAVDNSVPPALLFDPTITGDPAPRDLPKRFQKDRGAPSLPDDPAEIAFLPAAELGRLIRARQISSMELTELYLERLVRLDPQLECVITLTDERAFDQARKADVELDRGRVRSPLHGIPWGAKDLLAVRGYPTTWGAEPFRDQVIDQDATVVTKLDEAGAVLVAKLSLGALAWGDVWFDGTTRNPWNLEQGSSGSSAGPGAATSAGLVGFAIGSETWGSIVSPSTRCGVTGLRPTFGAVSRHGAMALSWSMDKLGSMGRSVEDCALVFDVIRGADGLDPTAVDRPFPWDPAIDARGLRVGYLQSLFEAIPEDEEDPDRAREIHELDLESLEVLRSIGVKPVAVELPDLPVSALSFILSAEAAAAFDELTRSGLDDELVRQIEEAWPNEFRVARTIPAVEYIQANRVRTLVMNEMARIFEELDVYVSPTFGGDNLLLTNLTGHPAVVVPNGFPSDGSPSSLTFTGGLHREAEVLAVAKAFQDATGHHLRRPPIGSKVKS